MNIIFFLFIFGCAGPLLLQAGATFLLYKLLTAVASLGVEHGLQ